MMNKLLTLLIFTTLLGCATHQTSVVVSDNYNQEADQTTLTIVPHGNINIPGKWTKTSYNAVSRQHFFENKDSITIAVTKNPKDQYPFYQKDLSDKEFTTQYYLWEKDYYEKQGYTVNQNAEGDNYVLWSATGKGVNTVFLYGAKNEIAYNFAVIDGEWSEASKTTFLLGLFKDN